MRPPRRGHRGLLVLILAAAVAACSQAVSPVPSAAPTTRVGGATSIPTTTLPSPTTTVPVTAPVPATSGDAGSIAVPEAAAPVIDGVLAPGEWEGAAVFPMSDGASISLTHDEATLYLAIAGDAVGSVNVLVASKEEVRILHSSAALGSALYEKDAGEWGLVHGFSWCCRSRSDDAARLGLLQAEGWQANIGFTGDPGIVEFQIDLPWQGASLAVSSIRDDKDMGFWPTDLPEEAQFQLVGVPPATRSYDIALWPVVYPAGG